jgi:alginate O-acetyltransferase complex protein AlgI
MKVTSLAFVFGLFVVATLVFLVPAGRPRQFILAVCNAMFLVSWVPNAASWMTLTAFVLSGYFVAKSVGRIAPSGLRSGLIALYLVLLLTVFLIVKKYQFLTLVLPSKFLSHYLVIVGLSYMLFRQIHFLIDAVEGQIEEFSLWHYLNYQINLFALLAGPIQRYQDFHKSWRSLQPPIGDWFDHTKIVARLFIGVIKVAFVGAVLLRLTEIATIRQLHAARLKDVAAFVVLFYAYPAYVFFNFSGYCDIVIAGANLVGIRLPENFNHPYLARNAIDFWGRWHITLTHWIRDYVFTPLYKSGALRWPGHTRILVYTCYFIAFFLAGIWHGSSWNFVIFGLLHGGAVAAAKMWEEWIIRRRGRAGLREYLKSWPVHVASAALTFNFVCFTFLFFPPGLSQRVQFLLRFMFEKP